MPPGHENCGCFLLLWPVQQIELLGWLRQVNEFSRLVRELEHGLLVTGGAIVSMCPLGHCPTNTKEFAG